MKIAVCIFGQPRFYKESAESFRKEFFDMPDNEVDVFIHCWDEIGYTPEDDLNDTNEKPNNQQLKDDIWNNYGGNEGHIKSMVIESPKDKFYKIADSFSSVIKTIRDEKLYEDADWRKDMGKLKLKGIDPKNIDCTVIKIGSDKVLRYEMGQFYSISQVIQQKAYYENQNNFKYDLVVRVRTDCFYIPPELYGKNKDDYYKDKEKYYSSLHTYYDGVGLMGHGLKVVCGIGNGAELPIKGKKDTGYYTDLEFIEFKDGKVIDISNAPYEKGPRILDSITDQNGMFSFPWKVHLKDWILVADSETSDRAWGGSLSVYMSFVMNDLVRFVGKKQIGFMPGGEVLNGLCGLLGDAKLCAVPDYLEENLDSRWHNIDLDTNKRRVLKIVNMDLNKRKDPFKPRRGEEDWQLTYGGGTVPHSTPEKMLENFLEYASSDRDKNNTICRTYRKNK
jgi:hypothetical protein